MLRLNVLNRGPDNLDRAEIATACDVSWDSLVGDHRVRHCGHCRQNVYNVQALRRAEALRLISEHEGRLCLRIVRRPDGSVVTADCWSRLRVARRMGFVPFLVMLIFVGGSQLAAIGVGISSLRRLIEGTRFAGKVPIPAHVTPVTIVDELPPPTVCFPPWIVKPPQPAKPPRTTTPGWKSHGVAAVTLGIARR